MSCGAGALIKGCFAPVLVVKGRLHKALGPISARQLCYMCMAVRMPDRWLVLERVTCFYCSKRVTFLVDCVKCVSIPIIKTL